MMAEQGVQGDILHWGTGRTFGWIRPANGQKYLFFGASNVRRDWKQSRAWTSADLPVSFTVIKKKGVEDRADDITPLFDIEEPGDLPSLREVSIVRSLTLRWNVQHGIIKPGSTLQSSKRKPMSVFDGFTPTLTVSSNSLVNLDGYRSLKIENGAAIILDTTKLTIVSLPQSGVFGYVIANFSNSRCSIRLSNGGLVGSSPTFLLASFGKSGGANSPGWCARWYFDGQNLNLV